MQLFDIPMQLPTIHLTIIDSITLNFYSTQSMKKLHCCAEARWQIHALKREQCAIKQWSFTVELMARQQASDLN